MIRISFLFNSSQNLLIIFNSMSKIVVDQCLEYHFQINMYFKHSYGSSQDKIRVLKQYEFHFPNSIVIMLQK